jgi:hypothetical protein
VVCVCVCGGGGAMLLVGMSYVCLWGNWLAATPHSSTLGLVLAFPTNINWQTGVLVVSQGDHTF